jgi:hypothetical protein
MQRSGDAGPPSLNARRRKVPALRFAAAGMTQFGAFGQDSGLLVLDDALPKTAVSFS